MDYPLLPVTQSQVSFNIFGTSEFKDCVLASIADNTITLKQTKGKNTYGCIDVNGQSMGCAWMDYETEDYPVICVTQSDNYQENKFFPWEYRESETFLFTPDRTFSGNQLRSFSNFVEYVEKIQYSLANLLKVKSPGYTEDRYVPVCVWTLLEFEFFRQITDLICNIEIGVAIVDGTLGRYAYVMTKVTSEDSDLKFCSVIKLN